jgi:steroid delta-isomerase-like uncharacterized protein
MTNKDVILAIFNECMNGRNVEAMSKYVASDCVFHSMPFLPNGPEGLHAMLQMFWAGFPDVKMFVDEAIAEGDTVFCRGHGDGTHQGVFNGVPATGRSISVGFMDCWHLKDGKLVAHWVQMDIMGMMVQLGVVPAPGA